MAFSTRFLLRFLFGGSTYLELWPTFCSTLALPCLTRPIFLPSSRLRRNAWLTITLVFRRIRPYSSRLSRLIASQILQKFRQAGVGITLPHIFNFCGFSHLHPFIVIFISPSLWNSFLSWLSLFIAPIANDHRFILRLGFHRSFFRSRWLPPYSILQHSFLRHGCGWNDTVYVNRMA